MSHYQDSFNPNPDRAKAFVDGAALSLQHDVPAGVKDQLARRGHAVKEVAGPIAHPVMLVIDPNTRLIHAAGDPAARRHAAAID